MTIEIIGNVNKNQIFCAGSFSKLVTTFVCLSKLNETYSLDKIIDDETFLDDICTNDQSKSFLKIFQDIIHSQFSIHDICSFYAGLPYTFDLRDTELAIVENGGAFKHHSIVDEKTFLDDCRNKITPVYRKQCKFHYSEISIIFFGYLIEKVFGVVIEDLYKQYILQKFNLKNSFFSRILPLKARCLDFSPEYDYPSIAILNHGYFAYSNGFYTNLTDMQLLLESLLHEPVFKVMTDIKHARAASNRLMNGLTIEIRRHQADLIYGYEGLSFSGCNIWAYSMQQKKGYLTFCDDEEIAYQMIYNDALGINDFDSVTDESQNLYKNFLKQKHSAQLISKAIPKEFQGEYHRVRINQSDLDIKFALHEHTMLIRNPELISYDVVYFDGEYRIKNKDGVHGAKIGLYLAESGHRYFLYDGTLYRLNR